MRQKINEYEFSNIGHKTASFGVPSFENAMSVETLIDTADKALYKSKHNGRNRVSTIQS